jgi:hypothetical protein
MPCECLSKTILRVCNVIFLLLGLAYVGLGIYILVDGDLDFLPGNVENYAYGCFAFGAFAIVLAVVGLMGTTNRCCMWIYTIFLTCVVLAQLGVAIFALVRNGDFRKILGDAWEGWDADQKNDFMEHFKCGDFNTDTSLTCNEGLAEEDPCFIDCYDAVESEFTTAGSVLFIVTLCIAGVEALLLVASCCLVCDDDYDDKE